eukprot:scaffold14613_cov59-Phaeocystis_antarctica.AAC.7
MAQPSASRLSGGYCQRQSMPQAAPSSGQPRPTSAKEDGWAALAGHIGLGFDTARWPGAPHSARHASDSRWGAWGSSCLG